MTSPPLAIGLAAAGLMALAQAPIPFVDDDRLLVTVVVVGFFVASGAFSLAVWPARRVGTAAAVVVVGTLLLEWAGHSTGWPFGEYAYTDALMPQVAGVPVIVPLAWFAMAVPAREVAAHLTTSTGARVALGAVALTAWDLMLDPQMVDAGYWAWAADGPWRGIPLSNYAGWLAAGAVVMVVLDAVLPAPGRSVPLLALYTWWGVSEALAFIVFFGDPVVGLVGGAVMLGLAALAWSRNLAPPRSRLRYVVENETIRRPERG